MFQSDQLKSVQEKKKEERTNILTMFHVWNICVKLVGE